MRIHLLLILLFSLCLSNGSLFAQACDCTNCPQFMQDLFVGDFNINIQGATNPTLGQNGQGVCGVNVHFDHTAICDISIVLTSPSGQSVTLVGPIGQFCTNMGNTGTDWDVSFVPCGSGAMPDPGFNAQWDNNQNWGANNNYTGSYYPFGGCLQNFSGPVNGNWTLTVTDGQANDTGNLFDYEIIFCDPSGINCISCVADAGILPQPDIAACEGAPELALDLPADYSPPHLEPPASDYTYTYVIGGLGGVIQAITPSPDMTALPAGNYTVCGLSYYNGHQNLLPMPNGVLTVTQLTNQLNSNTPPFCGNVTSNCVNVVINPIPPDEEETAVVCAPECYDFLGQFYCQTGDYYVDQMDANGCHYNAILHLTVNTPSFHTVNEIICPGNCSVNPTFPDACTPGMYQATLMNNQGCDSLVTLNLTVLNVNAVIQPPAMITCSQTSVPLSGIGSTFGSGTVYAWSASNGGNLSGATNLINATATAPGTYKLLVCRTISGVTCCDSTTVNVTSSITLPATPVINGNNSICQGATGIYSVASGSGATYVWTVPPGVNILSMQGDTLINVQWNSAAGGNICVTASNACGSSPQACLAIALLNTPPAPSLSGNLTVCSDSTAVYVADTTGGQNAFNWTITGGTISGGNGTHQIQVLWNGGVNSGLVCATASNNCGQGPQTCLPIVINAVPAMPVISGDTIRCAGTTGNYAIAALNGATGYVWTAPAGATIVSGQNTTAIVVSWATAPGGNVCASATNSCGSGAQQCFPVTVFAQPVANAGTDLAICGMVQNLTATPSIAGSTGLWTTVSGPGTATFANGNAANTSVGVDVSGIYQFQWTETNGICSDADTVQVAFNDSPAGGTVQETCDGTNQNYTITFPVSGGTAPYSIPGGTITNGSFTSNDIGNSQSYVFTITDANGCVSPAISGVYNCNCATNAGQMNLQLLTACPGSNVTAQASQGANLDADDIGAFILHSNPGAVLGTIFGENNTGVFTFVNGMTYGTTYYISYAVANNLNGLPDLTDPCLSVAPGQPVIFYDNPQVNAGMDVSGCGLTLMATGAVPAGSSVWTVAATPPGGSASISDPSNTATNVTATVFGTYTLTLTATSNGCTATDDVLLQFGNSPAAGVVAHTCDGANLQFTVNFAISGGQAPYTVNGQAVAGASFTSAPLPNGSNYNFVITDANGCVSGSVTGVFSCNCATNAGQVPLTPIAACQSDTITVQLLGGQNLDSDDVSAFVLHTGSGPALGTVIAQNHSGKFGFWASMTFGTTYYVSAVAGNNLNGFPDPNDLCFSVSPGQPIIFVQNPAPNAGADFVVCGLTAKLPATPGMFGGTWSQVSGPATASFGNNQDPVSQITVPIAGTYVFRWSQVNGICSASDDVEAIFWDNPVVNALTEDCNGTNTGYTVSFNLSNGAGGYTITGLNGTFSGNNFTSVELPNFSNYSFLIKDANGCQSTVIMGNHNCNCSTSAGTMVTNPLVFCADQPAAVAWNNDATLDADDAVRYILHNQAGGILGTVYATSDQPSFLFGAGLQLGTTYYISAIAGNNQAGNIDLNDPCLDISPGTPVQWKALPFAALSGDATICNGSSTVLNFNGTGSYPLQLTYSDGSGTPQQLAIPNPQTIPLSVMPAATTVYTLLSVTDGTAPACSVNLNTNVTVNVNQPVDAGVANAPATLCAGVDQVFQLGALITGEDAGGQWTETSAIPSLPGAFNATAGKFNTHGQPAGDYTFRYALQAALPCPSQSVTVTVTINPTPAADAGEDQLIDCHQDTVILGGPGTSVGANVHYSWLRAGVEIGNTVQLTNGQGGDYTLEVSNAFGCTSTDDCTVTVDTDIPVANVIAVQSVQCHGENNGVILLDSITSGHPPVMFSLNGDQYGSNHSFSKLEPGSYVVTLLDSHGCEWTTDTLTVEEPPLLTVDLGGEVVATFGDSVFIQANTAIPLAALESLRWNPLLDTLHAETFQQSFLPFASKYVTIELVDTNGCKAGATVLVLVQKPQQVYIPNIFHPGSTQFNDRLSVYGGHGVAEVESFRVFDRWGEQLFESLHFPPNEPGLGWDGAYRGDPVLPGVYVYVAVVRFIDGEVEIYKGDVTVLR